MAFQSLAYQPAFQLFAPIVEPSSDIEITIDDPDILYKTSADSFSFRLYLPDRFLDDDETVTSATVAATGLTFGECTTDNLSTPSSLIVPVAGGAHGLTYRAVVTYQLSSGGPLVKSFPVRVFD